MGRAMWQLDMSWNGIIRHGKWIARYSIYSLFAICSVFYIISLFSISLPMVSFFGKMTQDQWLFVIMIFGAVWATHLIWTQKPMARVWGSKWSFWSDYIVVVNNVVLLSYLMISSFIRSFPDVVTRDHVIDNKIISIIFLSFLKILENILNSLPVLIIMVVIFIFSLIVSGFYSCRDIMRTSASNSG